MTRNIPLDSNTKYMVYISFLGMLLLIASTLSRSEAQDDFVWRTPVIGGIFIGICVLGMLAVFFPNECSGRHSVRRDELTLLCPNETKLRVSNIAKLRVVHGHHPLCENFASHEFRIGKKTFCASCMGLFFGALISAVGAIALFFEGLQAGYEGSLITICGVAFAALGLLQFFVFPNRDALVRFVLNALFVFGMFLALVGADLAVHSTSVDLFIIFLSIYWLVTRINLSRWDHRRNCHECGRNCEIRYK